MQSLQPPLLTAGIVSTGYGEMFSTWLPDGNGVVYGRTVGLQKAQREFPYLSIKQKHCAWLDLSSHLSRVPTCCNKTMTKSSLAGVGGVISHYPSW